MAWCFLQLVVWKWEITDFVKLVVTFRTQTADLPQKFCFQVIAWKELEPNFKPLCHMGYVDIVLNYCSDSSDSEGRACVYEKLFYGLE